MCKWLTLILSPSQSDGVFVRDVFFPQYFTTYIQKIVSERPYKNFSIGVRIGGEAINNIKCVDDTGGKT